MIRLTSRPRKTVQDYMSLPDDVRAELIDGEFLMSPSPREPHQRISMNLAFALRSCVHANRLGRVYSAPFDVHLPTGDVVQPDVLFVSKANEGIIQDWIRGAPDLVIEIVSPELPERDRIVKRDLYARNGVREYWLVDDASKSVEILRLESTRFVPHGYFELQDVIESPTMPQLKLPVRDVFAE